MSVLVTGTDIHACVCPWWRSAHRFVCTSVSDIHTHIHKHTINVQLHMCKHGHTRIDISIPAYRTDHPTRLRPEYAEEQSTRRCQHPNSHPHQGLPDSRWGNSRRPVCVCMHVYVNVCVNIVEACKVLSEKIHAGLCVCVCVCVCVHVCVHVGMRIYMHVAYMRIYICMYVSGRRLHSHQDDPN